MAVPAGSYNAAWPFPGVMVQGSMSGGMTYRPPEFKPRRCALPKRDGGECRSAPTQTGACFGHNNAIGKALRALYGQR